MRLPGLLLTRGIEAPRKRCAAGNERLIRSLVVRVLIAITPFGSVAFIAAWTLLAIGLFRKPNH